MIVNNKERLPYLPKEYTPKENLPEQKLDFELKDNGNLIVVKAEIDILARTADKICKELDPNIFISYAEYFEKGEEIRPLGTYAIWIDKRKGEIKIQNRNARGHKETNEKMRKAVENTLGSL